MRVNQENINYNVRRMVSELVDSLYDFIDDSKDVDNIRIATLGEIRGICEFAKCMEEVLKA